MKAKKAVVKFPDYDNDSTARRNLVAIIKENSRALYPHEVAWYLSMSISEVYATVKRISGRKDVRFDPPVVEALKSGRQSPLVSSVKIESKDKTKSVGLPSKSQQKAGRKVAAALCL